MRAHSVFIGLLSNPQCKLASLLEGDVLEGVHWNPKAPAAAMQNFRKGLSSLGDHMGAEALTLPGEERAFHCANALRYASD